MTTEKDSQIQEKIEKRDLMLAKIIMDGKILYRKYHYQKYQMNAIVHDEFILRDPQDDGFFVYIYLKGEKSECGVKTTEIRIHAITPQDLVAGVSSGDYRTFEEINLAGSNAEKILAIYNHIHEICSLRYSIDSFTPQDLHDCDSTKHKEE